MATGTSCATVSTNHFREEEHPGLSHTGQLTDPTLQRLPWEPHEARAEFCDATAEKDRPFAKISKGRKSATNFGNDLYAASRSTYHVTLKRERSDNAVAPLPSAARLRIPRRLRRRLMYRYRPVRYSQFPAFLSAPWAALHALLKCLLIVKECVPTSHGPFLFYEIELRRKAAIHSQQSCTLKTHKMTF